MADVFHLQLIATELFFKRNRRSWRSPVSTRHTWEGDTYQHCDGVEGVRHLPPRCDGPYSGCRSGSGPRVSMSSRPVGVRVSPDNAMKARFHSWLSRPGRRRGNRLVLLHVAAPPPAPPRI